MDVYYKSEGKWNRSARLFEALPVDWSLKAGMAQQAGSRTGRPGLVISLTGGGGKTSLIRRLAFEGMELGFRVLITTTTHMAIPERLGVFSCDPDAVKDMLDREHAVVTGRIAGGGKISYAGDAFYESVCAMADLVLVEADGSKHLPIKSPGPFEPVIPGNTDMILCVAGLSALGEPAGEKCFRLEEAMGIMDIHGRAGYREDGAESGRGGRAVGKDGISRWEIRPEDVGCLMRWGYLEPLRALYPGLTVLPVLNQADTPRLAALAYGIFRDMREENGIASGGLLEEPSARLF